MKHIMVVTTSFPDAAFQSGQEAAGSFVYDFVVELAKWAQVTAVAPGMTNAQEEASNLTIRRFPASTLPLSSLKPTNPLQWSAIMRTMRSGQQAVTAVAQASNVDHIFALWALPSGYWAMRGQKQAGVPYSIWALGSDIWSLGTVPLVRQILREVLQQSQHCFADGYQLAADVTALSGRSCAFLPSSRLLPSQDPKQLATTPPYKLAFLGRWHKRKGIDLLLNSLDLLSDSDWHRITEVRIHGGGPLAPLVYALTNRLAEKGRPVSIGGYLNRQEATALYYWADYLLLPSRIESIPVIFSDALQVKCPIIAFPVGDIPRLLKNHRVGVLASAVTFQAMKEAIQQAFQTPPITFRAGITELANEFNIVNSVRRLLGDLLVEE